MQTFQLAFAIVLVFVDLLWAQKPVSQCKPTPDSSKTQYFVGYAGMMNETLLHLFYPTASTSTPARIQGYRRLWNSKRVSVGFTCTYLTAEEDPNASFNTGIFYLTDGVTGLARLDQREAFYCRVEVDPSTLSVVTSTSSNNPVPDGQYWILVNKPEFNGRPSKRYPIVQSDVDSWVEGCMKMETNFNLTGWAEECIKSTCGWSHHWVNDRVSPRKVAAFDTKAAQVDIMLNKVVPREFRTIQIE